MLLALHLVLHAPLAAQSPAARKLTGVVADARTGTGIVAAIEVAGGVRLRTDSAGRFSIDGLGPRRFELRARAIGFRQAVAVVDLTSDTAAHVVLRMVPVTPTLASIETVARREERTQFDQLPVSSALSFTSGELGRIPVVGERDVLRAVALLPGVASRNDMSSSFNVRGGEADQNLVLLDGIPIYNPFHLGGLFGTFIDATVGRVDLLTGGFPAAYGGRLSSVLEVTSAEEARPGIHGTTDLSILSSSATLAGAAAGGRLTWSAAARRTYADKVIEALHGSNEFPYHFRDAQLRVRTALPRNGSLSFTAYAGVDVLDESESSPADSGVLSTIRRVGFDWGNTVAGLTWSQPLSETTALVQRLSISTFHTHFRIPAESLSLAQWMGDVRVSGRLTRETGRHTLAAGYELSSLRSNYREQLRPTVDAAFPDAMASDGDTTIHQRGQVAALFVEDVWRVSPRLVLRPGLRAERMASAGWQGLSPRLTARYFVSPDLAFTATAGRFAQWTHAVRNEDLPLRLFDLWMVSGPDVPVSTATHFVVGAERWLSPSRFVRVEGYHKRFDGLSEPASSVDPRVRPSLLRRFDGTSYGVDVMARQLDRRGVSGWVSYGYAMSWRQRGEERYFAAHDRRHNANVVLSYAPGGNWSFGLHAGIATGTPYTGWAGRMSRWQYDPVLRRWMPASAANDADIVHGERNAERLPLYSRIDLSVERRITLPWGRLYPMLSVVNVLDRRNVLLYALDEQGRELRIRRHNQFPLLPSLGMRVEF